MVNTIGVSPSGSLRAMAMTRVRWPIPTPLLVMKRIEVNWQSADRRDPRQPVHAGDRREPPADEAVVIVAVPLKTALPILARRDVFVQIAGAVELPESVAVSDHERLLVVPTIDGQLAKRAVELRLGQPPEEHHGAQRARP